MKKTKHDNTIDDWAFSSDLRLDSLTVDNFDAGDGIVEDKCAFFAGVKDDAIHLKRGLIQEEMFAKLTFPLTVIVESWHLKM